MVRSAESAHAFEDTWTLGEKQDYTDEEKSDFFKRAAEKGLTKERLE